MGFIDDKGRIFGKLNIIDLLVILLIILAGVFLVFKIVGRGGSDVATGGDHKIVYTVKVRDVEPECYEAIKNSVPAQLMASGAMLDGFVVAVEPVEGPKSAVLETDTGALVLPMEDRLDLVFTIEASADNAVTQKVGTQEVRIGKLHIVKTTLFEFENGVILTCEKMSEA